MTGGARLVGFTLTNGASLVGRALPPSASGQHYEAWLADGKGGMVPMGGFRVAADGSVRAGMVINEDLSRYAYVDVSVERDGAPPRHAGGSILRADL